MPEAVQLLVYERFYPIFSILFGIGFGIFLRRAALRTDKPRVILARRLGWLFLIGLAHFAVQCRQDRLPKSDLPPRHDPLAAERLDAAPGEKHVAAFIDDAGDHRGLDVLFGEIHL